MSEYANNLSRLSNAAKYVDVEHDVVERLKSPKAALEVSIPVRMDDGSLKIFTGFRVQHSDARGPSKGGLRFHPDSNMEEVKSLAFWMTLKCALLDLPYGGGKGAVIVDTKQLSPMELERLSRGYVRQLRDFIGPDKDIPAPDMYTNPTIMAWMTDEYSKLKGQSCPAVFTGKPLSWGGSLGRNEATGRGGYYVVKEIESIHNWNPADKKVVVQGFGNAGQIVAQLLYQDGYKIIGISDSQGAIHDPNGLNIPEIIKFKNGKTNHGHSSRVSVTECTKANLLTNDELLALDCDLLIPAAKENAIREDNADTIKAQYILELANGPTTIKADEILWNKKINVVPDILANAGGVTVSYFEWVQNRQGYYWSEEEVNKHLQHRMAREFNKVYKFHLENEVDLRTSAYGVALTRLNENMSALGTQKYFEK